LSKPMALLWSSVAEGMPASSSDTTCMHSRRIPEKNTLFKSSVAEGMPTSSSDTTCKRIGKNPSGSLRNSHRSGRWWRRACLPAAATPPRRPQQECLQYMLQVFSSRSPMADGTPAGSSNTACMTGRDASVKACRNSISRFANGGRHARRQQQHRLRPQQILLNYTSAHGDLSTCILK